jgi:hypothetical protein
MTEPYVEPRIGSVGTWRIHDVLDRGSFVQHLDVLFPDNADLVLQDCVALDIQQLMTARNADVLRRGRGCLFNPLLPFIIKRPEQLDYRTAITSQLLEELSNLMLHHAESEVCTHLLVWKGAEALMEWNDWADRRPGAYVVGHIPEDRVRAFCEQVGCRYERSYDYGPADRET